MAIVLVCIMFTAECDDLGCDQLCVLDPLTGPTCLCGEGYVPENNSSTLCKRKFDPLVVSMFCIPVIISSVLGCCKLFKQF